jgi:Ca-activated chloride channel family protein
VSGAELGWLARIRVDSVEEPGWVAAGAAIALVGMVLAARKQPHALAWPAWPEALAAGGRGRDLGRWAALAARGLALSLLAVALAGPVRERAAAPAPGLGLDLALVVDASGSMRALDVDLAGEWRTRLDLAREVVARFARERAAEGDRVALVVFGETALTQCPLTSDGGLLAAALARVEAGMAGEATALGDAIALAVRRVAGIGAETPRAAPVPGRVVVVLTDGRSNAGAVPPDIAAALARGLGVRVHAVGIGSEGEVAMASPRGGPGAGLRFERHDLDAETLAAIAGATGGRFFPARRISDLEAVYREIDALERVARPAPPRRRVAPDPEPALALAGLLVALEIVTARGLGRRVP